MSHRFFSRAALAALIMAVPVAGAASAHAAPVVNQGDRIISASNDGCTVGFVDGDRAYTAAHCGGHNEAFYKDGDYIGNMTHMSVINGPYNAAEDGAYITMANGAVVGGNPYSGNQVASDDSVTVGSEICTYGDTRGRVACGTITGTDKGHIRTSLGAVPLPGDSGGAAWIPGEGFVGVISGGGIDLGGIHGKMAYLPGVTGIADANDQVPSIPNTPSISSLSSF